MYITSWCSSETPTPTADGSDLIFHDPVPKEYHVYLEYIFPDGSTLLYPQAYKTYVERVEDTNVFRPKHQRYFLQEVAAQVGYQLAACLEANHDLQVDLNFMERSGRITLQKAKQLAAQSGFKRKEPGQFYLLPSS